MTHGAANESPSTASETDSTVTENESAAVENESAAVEIRPFRPGDRDGVMALAPRLTEWVSAWREPTAVLAAVRGWVSGAADRASQDDHDHGFYVAEAVQGDGEAGGNGDGEARRVADGQIVGLVSVSEQTHFSGQVDAYVGELVVARGWEGRGIGGRLMRAAEGWAAGRGLSFITLHTGADNGPARRLYASLGFTLEDVRLTKPVGGPASR